MQYGQFANPMRAFSVPGATMEFHVTTPTGSRIINIQLPKFGPHGVLVSGGLDSSVLLSLILMSTQREVTKATFTALNVRRGFGTERFSEDVVARLSRKFGVDVPLLHLELPPGTPHPKCLTVPTLPLLNGRFRTIISADTSNPPGLVHIDSPTREPIENQHKYTGWKLPFLHCDKSHIVQLMFDLNLDFIQDMSHTCFAQDEYRCSKCFQCEERAWAFRSIGRKDTGEH